MNLWVGRARRAVLLVVVLFGVARAQEQAPTAAPTASAAPLSSLGPFPGGTLTYGQIVELAFNRCSTLSAYFSSNVAKATTFTALITRAINTTIEVPDGQIFVSLAPTKDAYDALFSSDKLTVRDAVEDVGIAETVLAHNWAVVESSTSTSAVRPSLSSDPSVEFQVGGKPASLADVAAAAAEFGTATVVEKDTGRTAKVVSSTACPENGFVVLGLDTAFAPAEYTSLSVPISDKGPSPELLPISSVFPVTSPQATAGALSCHSSTDLILLGVLASVLAALIL